MKHVTSPRRQIVMAALLGLAVLGAAMRYWAADPSLAHDIGTLLLVLWLPAVGNLIAFLVRQWHMRRPTKATGFDAARAFAPHLVVRISLLNAPVGPEEANCTVIVGNEGFSARAARPLSQLLAAPGTTADVELELLRPELALPRLAPGARIALLVGRVAVARGAVLATAPCIRSSSPPAQPRPGA